MVDMSRLQVVKAPASVLSRPTRPVENIDGRISRLADKMFVVMAQAKGVGLAANQIGLGISMFVYRLGDAKGVVINPVLTEASQEIVVDEEACLSLPGKAFRLPRPKVIWVTALDLDGNEVHYEAQDYLARMFCHELDHLAGRLLTDGNS